METNEQIKIENYFSNREVDTSYYGEYKIPRYLKHVLPSNKDAKILDIGCGFGQFLGQMKLNGFSQLMGIDINDEAINSCKEKGLDVIQINDIIEFAKTSKTKYDFITMSHVLEHIEKSKIIDTLIHIKKYLLSEGGSFVLMVPNAQSFTGSYWRYEDFTHHVMFTAGSCSYVLKSAGFNHVEFIDPDGTKHMSFLKKIIIKTLIAIYKKREDFWSLVLQTSYHKPSPRIYSFEIKVLAK